MGFPLIHGLVLLCYYTYLDAMNNSNNNKLPLFLLMLGKGDLIHAVGVCTVWGWYRGVGMQCWFRDGIVVVWNV